MDVLIAEDDDYSRDLLQASLQRWGYRVIAAPDGNAAWELLQKPYALSVVLELDDARNGRASSFAVHPRSALRPVHLRHPAA